MTDGLVSIRVQGLGSLADVTLRPGRLTVLIGPNGAGKSNVLRALKLVPLMRTQSLQRIIGEEAGKTTLRQLDAEAAGLATLHQQYPRFDAWITRLESCASQR